MTEKRFTIKPQDDYFGITDNFTEDKVNVINSIHTEIEAEWLCDLLNELFDENKELKERIVDWETSFDLLKQQKREEIDELKKEKEELEEFRYGVFKRLNEMIGNEIR